MFLILFSTFSFSQVEKTEGKEINVAIGATFGARAWQSDSINYRSGLDHGLDLWIYPKYDPNYEVHPLGYASIHYTSNYIEFIDEQTSYLHVRGGVGLTNSSFLFVSMNFGYLKNLEDNAHDVPTYEGMVSLSFPGRNGFVGDRLFIGLTGAIGGTFYNSFYVRGTKSTNYLSGTISVKYIFNPDIRNEKEQKALFY